MKRTLILVVFLLPMLIFFSSINNPVASGNTAGDCCQTFRVTNGSGEPQQGCTIIVYKDGEKAGDCLTGDDGTCQICRLEENILYTTVCEECYCTGPPIPSFYCGAQKIVEITYCSCGK